MTQSVVVGVDGSDSSLLALDWAADEAVRHGCPLRLVYASFWEQYERVTPSVGMTRPEGGVMARNVLAAAEQRAAQSQPDLTISLAVLPRRPVQALLDESRDAAALVVGSRGRGPLTGMLLGSVSLGVAGHATCPIIVVRGSTPARQGHFGRVVVGVDGTPQGAAAVDYAFHEAQTRAGALHAVHAWVRSQGDTAAEDAAAARSQLDEALADPAARYPHVPVEAEITEGRAHHVLLHATEAADLLVLGAHHRHSHRTGLHLGLVSHALLQHAPCPVAVIPQP